ncbi:MAG: glycosyltransferase family 4 protein [Mucilaginibacter sp.]
MRFVFASYVVTKEFDNPQAWLERIKIYANIPTKIAQNHEVFSIEEINYEGELIKENVIYKFLRLPASRFYAAVKLNKYIAALKPDIVIIHGLHFPLQVIHLRLLLNGKVKIIVQHHAEQPFKRFKKNIQRWAGKCIDAYLFASRDMGLDWVSKGNITCPEKVHEVMEVSSVFYPVEKRVVKAQLKITGQPVFLWVGRLNENKDPLTAINAFLKFVTIEPDARLYMIYHTEELLSQIIHLLNNHADSSAITLIGRVPNHELLYWYNSADYIISASHYEGSGTAVCEAMSCGCIPIVTDIFSFRMITDNGNCGLLYKAGNEGALLLALKQTRQLNVQQTRDKCLAYFNANLSFNAIANKIVAIASSLK